MKLNDFVLLFSITMLLIVAVTLGREIGIGLEKERMEKFLIKTGYGQYNERSGCFELIPLRS